MGEASRCDKQGVAEDYRRVRSPSNGGPSLKGKVGVERREDGTFKRKIPDPSVGSRFGKLTVLGTDVVKQGACNQRVVLVQCECGAEPHHVSIHNLLKGASTRCNVCAKKASGYWRKDYFKYADACPDDAHRRRLLNRLSSCKNRCHNPKDSGYPNYGGRGIRLYEPWRTDKAAFLRYVMSLDGWDQPTLELDRIDVDGDYAPGNLRFISKRENCNNKRKMQELQQRILYLEERLRHCTCGAAQQIHHSYQQGVDDRA